MGEIIYHLFPWLCLAVKVVNDNISFVMNSAVIKL